MSNRSLLEFNHDLCPNDTLDSLVDLAKGLQLYMRSGDKEALPQGVTFVSMRHHSEPLRCWPNWIDVKLKEKLPGFTKKVLVSHRIFGVIQAERQPHSSSNPKSWLWHAANGTWLNQEDVSHWTDLPEKK